MVLASFYCEQNDIHKMAGFLTEFHATTAIGSGNKWLADTVVRLLSYTTLHREYALFAHGALKDIHKRAHGYFRGHTHPQQGKSARGF